jgi:small GTP-binding protein
MILGIFLIEWDQLIKNVEDNNNSHLTDEDSFVEAPRIIQFFPEDIVTLNNSKAINRIIQAHLQEIQFNTNDFKNKKNQMTSGNSFKVQEIYDYGIYSCLIPLNRIVCLIFDKLDNPYDFTEEFENSILTFVLSDLENFNKMDAINLENVIISIFMDIRGRCLTLMDESSFYIKQQELKTKIKVQEKVIKVFLYGIDAAGKSSFVRYLKSGKFDQNYFSPTKKHKIHKIALQKNNLKIILWEMPGQKSFRRVWLRGVQASNLLIFILDAADSERFAEAKRAFWSITNRFEVKHVPLLFIANKIDLIENQQKLGQIESYFSLTEMKDEDDRKSTIKFMSLVTNEGTKEVISWISDIINDGAASKKITQ